MAIISQNCNHPKFYGQRFQIRTNLKFGVYHEARQSSQLFIAQTGFAAFGKRVQLISESPYAETEQLSRLTSPTGILLPHRYITFIYLSINIKEFKYNNIHFHYRRGYQE